MPTVYFIETSPTEVTITFDRSKMPKGFLPFPLRARFFVSDLFQWCMLEAYQEGEWVVIMDEGIQELWESRPKGWDTRHDNPTN